MKQKITGILLPAFVMVLKGLLPTDRTKAEAWLCHTFFPLAESFEKDRFGWLVNTPVHACFCYSFSAVIHLTLCTVESDIT